MGARFRAPIEVFDQGCKETVIAERSQEVNLRKRYAMRSKQKKIKKKADMERKKIQRKKYELQLQSLMEDDYEPKIKEVAR